MTKCNCDDCIGRAYILNKAREEIKKNGFNINLNMSDKEKSAGLIYQKSLFCL